MAFQPEVRGISRQLQSHCVVRVPDCQASDVGHLSLFQTNDFQLAGAASLWGCLLDKLLFTLFLRIAILVVNQASKIKTMPHARQTHNPESLININFQV